MLDINFPSANSQIPIAEKGWLLNLFHLVVREKLDDPAKIVSNVQARVQNYIADPCFPAERVKILEVFLAALNTHEALQYAAHVAEYEKLPLLERAKLKQQKQEQSRQNWLSQQPPTIKQLNYLAALGYRGKAPTSKLVASQLIDTLLKNNGGRAA